MICRVSFFGGGFRIQVDKELSKSAGTHGRQAGVEANALPPMIGLSDMTTPLMNLISLGTPVHCPIQDEFY